MRKSVLFFVKMVLVLSLVVAVGCGKDEGDDKSKNPENNAEKPVSDPEGTITIKVRNESNGCTGVYPDGCVNDYFYISTSNNFYGRSYYTFANIGKVSGLGNVTKIPNSGYAREVAVEPGCGYVAKCEWGSYYWNGISVPAKTTYVRIYVVGWTTAAGSSGGIIGAEIKYQSPFAP